MRRLFKIMVMAIGACAVTMLYYCFLFYPKQSMPVGTAIKVETPEPDVYHNDCLHPCIRYSEGEKLFYMAQSPYYAWNNRVENPMLFCSKTVLDWQEGHLISDTPIRGYNSDPNILIENDGLVYIWRECGTPLCDSIGCAEATVGGLLTGNELPRKKVFAVNQWADGDTEQAPVLIKKGDGYYIFMV